MFLQARNDRPEVRKKVQDMDRQIAALRASVLSNPDDAPARLALAGILCWRGIYQETKELLEPLADEALPPEIRFAARQLIGDNHFRHDQYDLAIEQYRENLELSQDAREDHWTARAEDGIAWILIDVGHYKTGEFVQAGRTFERLVEHHRERGQKNEEGMALYGVSRARAGEGKYSEALDFADQAIEVFRANGGEFLLQLPYLQLANVYRDRGDFETARPLYQAAVDAADESQDPYVQVLCAHNLGLQLRFTKQLEEAEALWKVGFETAKYLEFPRTAHEIARRLAKLYEEQGRFEDAYRFQVESQDHGSRVGVLSNALYNQQMLLRETLHRTSQLEEALSKLRAGVEASADGIFVLEATEDDEFVFRFVNRAAVDLIGAKPDEVNHVLVRTAWPGQAADVLLQMSRKVLATGRNANLDPIHLEFESGKLGCYAVNVAKIANGVVWTISDVSNREALQQEMAQANERLKALDREKSEVLGIAAHDLRSPIGNIRSLAELIETEDPEAQDFLKTIRDISDSLLLLIQNLLDVERIEGGKLDLVLDPLNFTDVVRTVGEHFAAEAAQKSIALRFDLDAQPAMVLGDAQAVYRVMQNLVSNAVKFSPPGETVQIRTRVDRDAVEFEVEDRGVGISESDRKRLFTKFARLTAKPTAGESSSGLGLSIVKRLVEAMDGEVGCHSEPGNGSKFWVRFARLPQNAVQLAA